MTAGAWLTTTAAEALLAGKPGAMSRATLWRWAQRGAIPESALLRSGNRIRIARDWLLSRAPSPTNSPNH